MFLYNVIMSKKSRGDKGEQKVISLLEKEKGYFKLINNLTLEDERGLTHQIDHIFINENGVFVLESKSLYGEIHGDNTDTVWIKIVRGQKINIHNPILQNKSHVRIVKRLLGAKVDVISAVIFTLNNAPYFPDENVINLSDLSLFINEYPYKRKMKAEEIDAIYNYLLHKESDSSLEEHLSNIQKIKNKRNQQHKEISYALENRKCPRCGGSIKEKNNSFYCVKCDFRFHL